MNNNGTSHDELKEIIQSILIRTFKKGGSANAVYLSVLVNQLAKHFAEEEALPTMTAEHKTEHFFCLENLKKRIASIKINSESTIATIAEMDRWLINHEKNFDSKSSKKNKGYSSTTPIMWSIFSKEFGTLIDDTWFFKNHTDKRFHFASTFFLEKLWIMPSEDKEFCYESTGFLSNKYLHIYSNSTLHPINNFWEEHSPIFKTDTSHIEAKVDSNQNLIYFNTNITQSKEDLIIKGGCEAVDIATNYINRFEKLPIVITFSENEFELCETSSKKFKENSNKYFQKYGIKTAIIANNLEPSKHILEDSKSTKYLRAFNNLEEMKNWII